MTSEQFQIEASILAIASYDFEKNELDVSQAGIAITATDPIIKSQLRNGNTYTQEAISLYIRTVMHGLANAISLCETNNWGTRQGIISNFVEALNICINDPGESYHRIINTDGNTQN